MSTSDTAKLVFTLLVILCIPILGALFGAIIGWCTGLFYTDTLTEVQLALGFTDAVEPWKLGVFFGFIGGFFKATLTNKN